MMDKYKVNMALKWKIMGLLCIFSFLSCSTSSYRVQLETVFSTPSLQKSSDNDFSSSKTMEISPGMLEPSIIVLHESKKSLEYQLQGFLSSSGLRAQRIAKITLDKQVKGDTLYLVHIVEVARVAGKEGNNTIGYNYTKKQRVDIPENTAAIEIELYQKLPRSDFGSPEDSISLNPLASIVITTNQ
ncbi:hypothetical protein ACYSNM_10845 [Myroides sp. LJL116]